MTNGWRRKATKRKTATTPMNQAQLVGRLAKKQKLSSSRAKEMVQLVLSTIQDSLLKGESVRTTLGTFTVAKRAARQGINPKTGQRLAIKASRAVRFKGPLSNLPPRYNVAPTQQVPIMR